MNAVGTAAPSRWPRAARRGVAFAVVLTIPAYVSVLVARGGPVAELAHADATYIAAELIQADRRVRKELARLRPRRTAAARSRTRQAIATTRSLTLEMRREGGAEADRLRRALRLEADWLDAVGSTLANPRSVLRERLVDRDAELGPALVALPGPAPVHDEGSRELLDYARRRERTRSARAGIAGGAGLEGTRRRPSSSHAAKNPELDRDIGRPVAGEIRRPQQDRVRAG